MSASSITDAGVVAPVPSDRFIPDAHHVRVAPLADVTLALTVRVYDRVAVVVADTVPAPMVAAVARHALAHDVFTLGCRPASCWQASNWQREWSGQSSGAEAVS